MVVRSFHRQDPVGDQGLGREPRLAPPRRLTLNLARKRIFLDPGSLAVGVGATHGDFNVAWDVILVIFTGQGVADGAINHRIPTLTELNAAVAAHDALTTPLMTPAGQQFSFNCSVTSEATYVKGAVLSFP